MNAQHRHRRPATRLLATSLAALLALTTSNALAGPAEQQASGIRAFQNGKYEAAVADLKAAMDAKPSAKTALYLGNAYLKLDELDLAKEAFEALLRLEPNHPKKVTIETLIRSIDARAEVKVHIESTPPGATIYVDDLANGSVGVTPADVNITIGKRRIILVKEGFAQLTKEVVLKTGTPLNLTLPLPGTGCLVHLATSNSSAAVASVNGQEPIALPADLSLPAGDHKVRFTASGYQAKDEPIACDGFAKFNIAATLVPESGRVTVARVAGSVVRIDGKIVAVTPEEATRGINLAPGRHEISITTGDDPPRISIIDVQPGQTIALGLPADSGPAGAFPRRALYFDAIGGGNITLRDWRFGANAFQAQSGRARFTPSSSAMAGARVGFQVTPRFAVETEAFWMSLPNELDTSHGLSYGINAVYHLLPTRVTPVVEGGVGIYQVLTGDLGADLSPRGHLGVGLRARVKKWLSLRVDVRDVISRGFETGGSNNLELLGGAELFLL